MQRFIGFLLFVLVSTSAVAQEPVTITLKSQHEYGVFEAEGWPTKQLEFSASISGDTVKQPMKGTGARSRLFLVDKTTGNVAAKTRDELSSGNWAVVDSHFLAAEKVEVEVVAPGGPIDSATVILQDSGGDREELISPASKGKATFWYVKFGEFKVTVKYRGKDGMATPVKQSFTVTATREDVVPKFTVALPDGGSVAVGKNEAAAPDKKPAGADKQVAPSGTGTAGNLLTTLIGLGIAAAVGYFILKYFRENSDKVQSTLTKLGADVPQISGNSSPDYVPIEPIKPEPMAQIILDAPSPASPVIAQVVATGTPKLIASDGSAFELPEGETVVGREFGNGLVVPNDTVSRKHASLQKSGPMVTVTDHGSTNGTWVNGVKVSAWTPLSPDDLVRFGSIEYRFEG